MLLAYACLVLLTGWRLTATPGGFIPAQDQGSFPIGVSLPAGSTLQRTDQIAMKAVNILLQEPGIAAASVQVGVDPLTSVNAADSAQIYAVNKPFDQRRGIDNQAVMADLRKQYAKQIVGADVRVLNSSAGARHRVRRRVQDDIEDRAGRGYPALEQAAKAVADAANKSGLVSNAFVTFNNGTPRLFADIDRDKAEALGVADPRSSTRCRPIWARLTSTTSPSWAAPSRFWPRRMRRSAHESRRSSASRRAQHPARWCRWARWSTIKNTTGPYRVVRYNLYPCRRVQATPRPATPAEKR